MQPPGQESLAARIALFAASVALGLAIAWVDSRPNWDDSGITAGALLLSSGLLGLIAPRRPWRWALALGVWIPLELLLRRAALASLASGLVIFLFPLIGAYTGMGLRRLFSSPAANAR